MTADFVAFALGIRQRRKVRVLLRLLQSWSLMEHATEIRLRAECAFSKKRPSGDIVVLTPGVKSRSLR
jgi:hypothetical protein